MTRFAKLLVATQILLTGCVGVSHQIAPPTVRGVGSASTLAGKLYTLTVFVSEPGRRWKSSEKEQILKKEAASDDWLMAQARTYNIDLAFQGSISGLDQDVSVPYIPSATGGSDQYKYWVSYILNLIGWKNPLDYWSWVSRQTHCTNLQVLIFANTSGVSYSIPYISGVDPTKFFVEGSMIYHFDANGKEVIPAQIAHETLHLYGAWDLYQSYSQTADREAKARVLFPDDIMLRLSYNLSELRVGPLTAWRVGWNGHSEPWYDWFRPSDDGV